MTTKIKLVDLARNIGLIRPEIENAIGEVIGSTDFILGSKLVEFEYEYSEYSGAKYAIGVASGTAALMLSLEALNVGPGDEVITSALSFFATAEAILRVGATPVFVDISPITCCLDTQKLTEAITEKTRAIIPVHLYGRIAEMDTVMNIAADYGLYVIEDAAQSHGAAYKGKKAGSLGHIGCVSFYPGKNLGAFGDAGAVLTSDSQIAENIRMLRNHGRRRKYVHEVVGFGERMDTLQAAILLAKLPYLDDWVAKRRKYAMLYNELLADIEGIALPNLEDLESHALHIYAIRTGKRDELKDYLLENGIETGVHYPLPLHLQPAIVKIGQSPASLPIAEEIASTTLSLPMYPELTEGEIEYVSDCIHRFFIRKTMRA